MLTMNNLGEKKIIEIIRDSLDLPDMFVKFGDDVSAVQIDDDQLAILKTDMLVDETDIPPIMTLRQAARKAVIMNISDLAAKGVPPIAGLVALGLPGNMTEKDLKNIALGLNDGVREYGTNIIGGDTNESRNLIISCAFLGLCSKEYFVSRRGVNPGDIVAVTGRFGNSAAGLRILLDGLHVNKEIEEPLKASVLYPQARLKEGVALSKTKSLTSSIDSSDGLAWCLHEIADLNNIGFSITNIPISPETIIFCEKYGYDPEELALFGGEEYELVVTIKPELWEKAFQTIRILGSSLIRIGSVIDEKNLIYDKEGKSREIQRKGWEHFST